MNPGDRRVVREFYGWTDEFGSHREDWRDIEEFWDGTRWRRGRPSRRLQQKWAEQARQAEEQARREVAEQQRRHRRNLLLLHRY